MPHLRTNIITTLENHKNTLRTSRGTTQATTHKGNIGTTQHQNNNNTITTHEQHNNNTQTHNEIHDISLKAMWGMVKTH